jgi:iron(II)-dependent oxidoreductase
MCQIYLSSEWAPRILLDLDYLYSMDMTHPVSGFTPEQLVDKLAQARGKLRELIEVLPAAGWLGPRADHLNPPLWEFGHVVWFQERWCLRAGPDHSFADSLLPGADALYDSSTVPHDTRWNLPLPVPTAVDDYAARITAAVSLRLRNAPGKALAYFAELSLYHELMHIEAWWMAFQNLGYAPPVRPAVNDAQPARHDRLVFAEAEVFLGGGKQGGFIFDNEKWRHAIRVPAFDIDTRLVSETRFAEFVDAGGYQDAAWWSEAGLSWRKACAAAHPVYWKKEKGSWQVRRFAQWGPLVPDAPVLHLNRFEAEACAAWLGRRLPAAGQWLRATQHPRFCWGDGWEWMRDPFAPYPGFSADPYQAYSQPWFHSHGELRGGGPFTDPQLKRTGFRNFYLPHRRDPFSGFRTVSMPD